MDALQKEFLRCPITRGLLVDPVVLKNSGIAYSRAALDQYLSRSGLYPKCPVTQKPLMLTNGTYYIRDFTLASVVDHVRQHSSVEDLEETTSAGRGSTPPPSFQDVTTRDECALRRLVAASHEHREAVLAVRAVKRRQRRRLTRTRKTLKRTALSSDDDDSDDLTDLDSELSSDSEPDEN